MVRVDLLVVPVFLFDCVELQLLSKLDFALGFVDLFQRLHVVGQALLILRLLALLRVDMIELLGGLRPESPFGVVTLVLLH